MYHQAELVSAINKLQELLHSDTTEHELDAQLNEMSKNILDPEWQNYVFHSDEFTNPDGGFRAESLADKILSYKPIAL